MGKRRTRVKDRFPPPATCTFNGKRIYHNRKEASSAVAYLRRTKDRTSAHWYHCPRYNHLHVGSDNFNKDKLPNRNNSALAHRAITILPARPVALATRVQPVIPWRSSRLPPVGFVVKRLWPATQSPKDEI